MLEIRPHGVHKGIVSGPLSAQAPGKILVAAGNDRTDEDLFMALHETAITSWWASGPVWPGSGSRTCGRCGGFWSGLRSGARDW